MPVAIERLLLSNFRNYEHLSLNLGGNNFALVGSNGSGKTNFLEAFSLFAPGRGLRRASYDQMLRVNATGRASCYIELKDQNNYSRDLATVIECDEDVLRRRILIDNSLVSSDALLSYLRLGWFVPSMDGMFTGAESERRRFIDRMVLALDAEHAKRVSEYEKLSSSRNKLLKQHQFDPVWLDSIEAQLARLSVAICLSRLDLIEQLRPIANLMPNVGFPSFSLCLAGQIEQWLADGISSLNVEDRMRSELKLNRLKDKMIGRSLLGAHRTELKVEHLGKKRAAALCSTGEQKILLIGLILSHAYLTKFITKLPPILLLDEVVAHLDRAHKSSLFAVLDDLGGQFFVTGAELELFNGLEDRFELLNISDLQANL